MRILTTLLFAALPFQAAANVDCSVIDALERVQFAQMRLAQTAPIDPTSADAQLIIREVGRLDVGNIAFATKTILSSRDVAQLIAAYGMSDALARTLITRQPAKSRNILAAASFTEHINQTKRILPLFKCNTLTDVRGTDGLEKASSTLGASKPGRKFEIVEIGFWLIGMIVAGGAAVALKTALTKRQARNKRRSKRYPVNVATQIKNHNSQRSGTILDISCNGIKIKMDMLPGDKTGTQLKILLGEVWHAATISWSNAHYIGVRFSNALPHAQIMDMRNTDKKT